MNPVSLLLVDDNPVFLRVVDSIMRAHGEIEVIGTATGAEEALVQTQELRPQAILLDMILPDMHGLDVIPLLRVILPDVRIIVVTLLTANGYRKAALEAGADDFVAKANINTELLPAIRRAMKAGCSGESGKMDGELGQGGP